MKTKILVIGLLISFSVAHGQEDVESSSTGSGWMAYFQPGSAFRLPNDFGLELNTLLRESENYPQTALMIGGGGMKKFSGKMIVGLSGFGLFFPKVDGNVSSVGILGGGVDVNVGYTLKDDGKFLGYPRLGVGLLNYVTTIDVDPQGFLVDQPPLFIPPGNQQKINGSVVYLDIGIDVFRSFIPQGGVGPIVGVSIGYQQSIGGTTWETEDGFNIDSLTDPELSNIYLKINFGGGGFK